MSRTLIMICTVCLACLQIFNFACRNVTNRQSIQSFRWLAGEWKSTGEMNFFEMWNNAGANEIRGIGFINENGDTLMSEQLMIFASDSGIFYQASVAGQNDQHPILFKLIAMQNDSFVFFNPAHDFPKLIAYKVLSGDSLRVHVLENANEYSKGFRITMIKQP